MSDPGHLVTDALGFRLEVIISIGNFSTLGQHRTHENESGKVLSNAVHQLNFKSGMTAKQLNVVAAHEVYHLFYSVRESITTDEETQAEVFGGLVGHIHTFYELLSLSHECP